MALVRRRKRRNRVETFCSAKLNSAFPYGTEVRLCVLLGARAFAYSADSENFKLVDSPRLCFRLKAFARDLPAYTHTYTNTQYIALFNVREKNSISIRVCVCLSE